MESFKISPPKAYSSLRPYQQRAFDKMSEYYNEYSSSENTRTGLVAMPTGSGKTPIMAVLARCHSEIKGVLIISPRVAISKQLEAEISYNLFRNKFKISQPIPKQVVYYKNDNVSFKDNIENSVIIATTQKIDYLKKNERRRNEYELLINNISLVIFDEGHYEPANSWSHTIRAFKCPRIIFSATPFRNDLKSFDIDWEHAFSITYDELRTKKYLRKVDFNEIKNLPKVEDKIDDILFKYDKLLNERPGAKLIINCDNRASILKISRLLFAKERKFISIHEAFTSQYKEKLTVDYRDSLVRKVPEHPENEDSLIWIHQYKLLEGIDDPSFQMLCILEPLRNVRSLVQQIGRVIRNPMRDTIPAFVYDYTKNKYKEEWSKYLEIDKTGEIIKGFSGSIFKIIDEKLPDSAYIDGKIRDKLKFEEFENWKEQEILNQIKLPLKINLLQKLDNFKFDKLIEDEIEKRFREKDKIRFVNPAGKNSILYYYFSISNSSYLNEKYYPEITHDVCFIKEFEDFIAFFDSSNYLPYGKHEVGIGFSINPDLIKGLFHKDKETVLTRVALKNSNFGSREIRAHSFIAPSIEETTPFLNDFSHYMSSAFGKYTDKKEFKLYKDNSRNDENYQLRTYIGLSTGRISQNEPTNLTFNEYTKWLDYIVKTIRLNREYLNTFKRYATEQLNVIDTEPKNILLDLFDYENDLTFEIDGDIIKLSESIPDKCLEIFKDNAKRFLNLCINEETYKILIKYDNDKNKFLLEAPDLEARLIGQSKADDSRIKSLLTLLNEKQSFRILTEKYLVYAKGYFYKPSINIGREFNIKYSHLEKILIPIRELETIGSEKGKRSRNNDNDWDEGTLFNLVATLGKNTDLEVAFENAELLICDDKGTEIADFILLMKDKLVLIHIKGIGNKPDAPAKHYSASAISEVCNQAIKNIHYLSMFDTAQPQDRIKKWTSPWHIKNKKIGVDATVTERVRLNINNLKVEEFWGRIEELKFNPNIDKEVWLLLGKVFSKKVFIDKLSKDLKAEAIQSAITLQSTLASIGSVGAKLKIFCSRG